MRTYLYVIVLVCFIFLCADSISHMNKIKFDIKALDHHGLVGPVSGKVSLSYEFCIPKNDACRSEVERIDSSIEFSSSPGRIGCTIEEYLCIGHTNQKYKKVLKALTKLDYLNEIERAYFE